MAGAVGLICGLKSEARALAPLPWPVLIAGGCVHRAEALAREAVAKGAERLVSIGLAGGLAPDLAAGTVIDALAVVTDTDSYAAHTLPALNGHRGAVFGAQTAVLSVADKRALHQRTGAVAVDMESLGVARAARDLGVPLSVLRVIADPAHRSVPAYAAQCLRPDGSVSPGPVLRALLARPGRLGEVLALRAQSSTAHAQLARLAKTLAGFSLIG